MFPARCYRLRAIRWQWCLLGVVFSLIPSAAVRAELLQPGVMLARSHSGQFVIQSLSAAVTSREVADLETRSNFVRLDPALLPVSSERIKQLLWRELGAQDTWSGKIFLKVYPATSADDRITIGSEQFRDGWQYGVALPSGVQR